MVNAHAEDPLASGEPTEQNSDAGATPAAPNDSNDAAAAEAPEAGVDGDRPSQSQQPSNKKRRSDVQLNKDDNPEGAAVESDEDGDLNDEGGKRSDPFKRATEDVLKGRRIVKASRKWTGGNGGSGATGGGTFASVKLAPVTAETSKEDPGDAKPTFGSSAKLPTFGSAVGGATPSGFGGAAAKSGGFGYGFGGVSAGFGALKPSSANGKDANSAGISFAAPSKSAFGGGFGATSTGFGSLKSTASSGFGSSANAMSADKTAANCSGLAGTFVKSPNKASGGSPTKFPTSSVVDTANGEQDEDCLCQVRARLFKMVPDDEDPDDAQDSTTLKGDVPSVPSTSGRMDALKAKNEDKEESAAKETKTKEAEKKDAAAGGDGKKPKLVQKEAGIGPVRVLKRKPPVTLGAPGDDGGAEEMPALLARVVQRQETSGGQATRVILNVRLVPKACSVVRRGDKFVQLNAPDGSGGLECSLFKVKTTTDADTLEKNLKLVLEG